MVAVDTQFVLWGSAYVILKWTVGVWAFRQAKAYLTRHTREPYGLADVIRSNS